MAAKSPPNRQLTLFTMVSGRANDITMFTIAPHISWHAVDGELALFDERDGGYHTLNQSAAAIWRGIADHQPIAQLCDDIANARNVPHVMVRGDVEDFIRAALDMGLIVDAARAP